MKDGIIKGTGDSRYLKGAGWPSTYAEFKAMAEAGALPFDLNGINAAGWQQEGTALNKRSLLDDTACGLIGIATASVPNDAFIKLALGTGKYGYYITVKDPDGNALSGVTVSGVTTQTGGTCLTNIEGSVVGVSPNASVSLSFTHNFIDLNTIPSRTVQSTGTITQVVVTATRKSTMYAELTSSQTFRFSPAVNSYDIAVCGGGGGGGWAFYGTAGGGGGGYLAVSTNKVPTEGATYAVTIGAGGSPGPHITDSGTTSVGGTGGASTFKENSTTMLNANGGVGGISARQGPTAGGTGNGVGGTGGSTGGVGVISGFYPCSGGGAGSNSGGSASIAGGSPYGASSAYINNGSVIHPNGGSVPGGGGAGSDQSTNSSSTPSAESYGGAGGAKIAWRYAS